MGILNYLFIAIAFIALLLAILIFMGILYRKYHGFGIRLQLGFYWEIFKIHVYEFLYPAISSFIKFRMAIQKNFIPKDESHNSLNMDIETITTLKGNDLEEYIYNLMSRRKQAHEKDLKNK